MEYKKIRQEIETLEWHKKDDALTENGLEKLKELKLALSICEVKPSNDLISRTTLLNQIEKSRKYYENEVNRFDYSAGLEKALYLVRVAKEVE